ncbi:MAG: DUF1232 domain-containing protein [Bacteroidales bacterium]|nr:DUF1232 domain-containing protein [Bacteroidales bacterium]
MGNTTNIDFSVLKDGLCNFAKKAGRTAARPALLLYYVMKSDQTPRSDKLMILSTLAYLVLPIDLISAKRLPFIGRLDEVVSLSVAIQKMSQRITPEIERQADAVLDRWLAEYTPFEEML